MPGESRYLRALYPFLHGEKQDPHAVDVALLDSVQQKAAHSIEVKRQFFAENGPAIVAAGRAIAAVYRGGGRMLAIGNGGSSCDAAHFAVEFLHPITAGRPALPAINLVADDAMLTAVGNDIGFEHVFARQVIAQGKPGDGLVGFSTSGNSPNLLMAFARAREMKLTTIGMAGGDGGEMSRSPDIDHCLVVATDSIHRIQEVHVTAYHILWDLVHTLLADERGGLEAGS
jgi:D-sedoheptulose 7-phosphate isomerase